MNGKLKRTEYLTKSLVMVTTFCTQETVKNVADEGGAVWFLCDRLLREYSPHSLKFSMGGPNKKVKKAFKPWTTKKILLPIREGFRMSFLVS